MRPAGAARRSAVVTFLFSDIEGSTSAWERSPESMRKALFRHDAILEEETSRNSGSVFKRVGDGFCCAFEMPGHAVRAAIGVQRRLASEPWPPGMTPLRARVGIHTGTAFIEGDDYFGPSLNRVARLMAAGHGGQILVSSSTAALLRDDLDAGVELHPLGSHRLKDLSEPETIFQVVAAGIAVDFPGLNTLDSRANNLPSQISSFVGRDVELRELAQSIAEHRLLTIAGPGGIGKSRLLLQLAAELITAYKDGIWFVSLASIREPRLVAGAVASALRISETPGESYEETLLRYLAPRELLLAIDNAEHLLGASALLAKHILERAPFVRIATTSREPLHVRGERIFRIEPLGNGDSARLFIERARELEGTFSPGSRERAEIKAICRQVQGIPLAIELAAARTATLSLEQIHRLLHAQLSFLSTPPAPEDDRHRTLRSTIAWSYDLLSRDEQKMLAACSVFMESFTLDACEAVAERTPDVLNLVASLADKSFVMVQRNGEVRYRLLEAVRSYAQGEAAAAFLASAQKRHAKYYFSIALQGARLLLHGELADWMQAVDADIANIRAALGYAFTTKEKKLGEVLVSLRRYWYIKRQIAEGRAWLERYADTAAPADASLPAILSNLASLACLQHDYDRAARFANKALRIYSRRKDAGGKLEVKHALAVNEYRRGDIEAAERLYKEIVRNATQRSQRSLLVLALRNLATLKLFSGDPIEAEKWLQECRRRAEELGDAEQLASIEGLQGSLAYERGDLAAAEEHFERALEASGRLGNDFGVAEVALGFASVCLSQGKADEAKRWIGSSLSLALGVESPDVTANALETYAEAEVAGDDWETALKVFVDATAIRRTYCHAYSTKLGHRQLLAHLRERFGNRIDAAIGAAGRREWKTAAQEWLASLPQPQQSHA